ncbi:hypothetical protein CRYUN_Cryun12cG0079200 [Craigia yunnanensis]
MAATEARAAREHIANPRFVKEDAGRATKFSGCPSSSSPRLDSNGTPSGAASGPDQTTSLRVPDNQNLFGLEVSNAGFDNESPKISKDHYFDGSSVCIKDGVAEDSGNAYAECVKSDRDVRKEESNPVLNSNAQKPPNKNIGESWYLDDHLIVLEHNCLISKQPKTLYSDFESQLVQSEKTEPWWRMTDKDELASMVAQKSLEHIENCLSDLSNHHWERATSVSLDESQCMLGDKQNSLPNSDNLLSRQFVMSADPCGAQASQLFAYKQWLQLLQLENFSLRLTYKNQPISRLLPAGLPWVPYKGMQVKKAEHKVVKQKKSSSKDGAGRSTTAFFGGIESCWSWITPCLDHGVVVAIYLNYTGLLICYKL